MHFSAHGAMVCVVFGLVTINAAARRLSAELLLHFDMEQASGALVDVVHGLTADPVDAGQLYGVQGPTGFGTAAGLEDNGSWQLDVDESRVFGELANDFTVAAWLYLDSDVLAAKSGPNAELNRFFGDDVAWDADGWGMGVFSDGRIRFTKNGVVDLDTADAWFETDGWHHLAATVSSADGVTVYYDGEVAQNFADTRNLKNGLGNNHAEDLYGVGRTYGAGESQWVGGFFDEIRVYDSVLTETEVKALLTPGGANLLGDVNGDHQVDAHDIDALAIAVLDGKTDTIFDVNQDHAVTLKDHDYLVTGVLKTWIGDANLDGEFNTIDFVNVFQLGEYEDSVAANSTWSEGDWDGNREFDSADFVSAFVDGGYEAGPRAAVLAVPEPSSLLMGAGASIWIVSRRRRR